MIYIVEELVASSDARDIFSNILRSSGVNEFEYLEFLSQSDAEIVDYIKSLKYKSQSQSDVIIITSNRILNLLTGKNNIDNWRGSVLEFDNIPLLITYPPSRMENEFHLYPIVSNDLGRIRAIEKDEYHQPEFEFDYKHLSFSSISDYLTSSILSVDIESVKGSSIILCVGFAISRTRAISLDFKDPQERSWIKLLLESDIPKLFHNGNFDVTMLELNGLTVNNYKHDTMLMSHILAPELPRSLAFLTSIYTNINYYKSEGKKEDDSKGWSSKRTLDELKEYNCKDVCATLWCYEEMLIELLRNQNFIRLYYHEIQLAIVTIEMGHNGLLLDLERNEILRVILNKRIDKSEFIIKTLVGANINIRSPKHVPWLLYEHYKLPKRKKYDKKTKTQKDTTDNDALISLISFIKSQMDKLKTDGETYNKWKVKLIVLNNIIQMRGVKKLMSSYIDITTHNGRVKSTYKPAGTESGRLSTGNFVDGSGINLATLPREAIEE